VYFFANSSISSPPTSGIGCGRHRQDHHVRRAGTNSLTRGLCFGGRPENQFTPKKFKPQSNSSLFILTVGWNTINPDDYDLLPPDDINVGSDGKNRNEDNSPVEETARPELKRRLYQLAASYDRGFSATPKARREADEIIANLGTLNPTQDAARDIDGDATGTHVPLEAIWRMIWTSAFDVVSLGASPFAAPSAIYQDITNPPIATNIIDFIPRAQTLINFSPLSSLLRAEVTTRASSRRGFPNRVGLVFEGVKLQPIELLGQKVSDLPPLTVDFTWPRSVVEQLASFVPGLDSYLGLSENGADKNADAPGYFDVEYLDDELLIIRQQAPGGLFALVKVDNCDP
jgi:hypothetical protein